MYINYKEKTNTVHPIIAESLGLSEKEKKVFDVLTKQTLGRNVSVISKNAGLPRTTTFDILRKFKKRGIAMRVFVGKRYHWRYKKGLERLYSRNIGE